MTNFLYPKLINTRRIYKVDKWYCMIETPVWNEYGAVYIRYKKYNHWHAVAVLSDEKLEPVVFQALIATLQRATDIRFDNVEQILNYIDQIKTELSVAIYKTK